MGHLGSGSPIYEKLGSKLNNLTSGCPWNENLSAIVRELYSEEDADVILKMPYFLSNLERIAKTTGYERERLRKILDGLVERGLVIDLLVNGESHYMTSPIILGFFEFTMMRRAEPADHKRWAKLFESYLSDGTFYRQFLGSQVGILRALPHEGTLQEDPHVEILNYELAEGIIHESSRFAVEPCSCRHERFHLGEKSCKVPIEHCTTIGTFADSIIRNGFGREISRTEMKELCVESKELGLVLCADNVKNRVNYICHCCGCCCNLLRGLNRYGHTNLIVSSNFAPQVADDKCNGCARCVRACPVHAIEMSSETQVRSRQRPTVDIATCLGCGVCATSCNQEALKLAPRARRSLVPETTFHRLILQHIESGKLQFQLFDNPNAVTHQVMRAFLGGFLRLPLVKRAMLSKSLGSVFFSAVGKVAALQGRGWVRDL